ncbi:hypothetical protein PENSPDRAFT_320155 [Peniophora sp. CONT]|nr:hypothetical protein PENSPDRAFT_320155 [Peniophora sp. CONT]
MGTQEPVVGKVCHASIFFSSVFPKPTQSVVGIQQKKASCQASCSAIIHSSDGRHKYETTAISLKLLRCNTMRGAMRDEGDYSL